MSVHSQTHLTSSAFKKIRLRVLARDGYTCAYCGQPEANQVDHVVPIARGGDIYDMDNLVASCRRCNLAKGTKSKAVFLLGSATPPVSLELSLPKTTSSRPTLSVVTTNEPG